MAQKSEHDRLIFYYAVNPMLYVNFRCEIDLEKLTEYGQFSDAVGVKWVSKIYYISYIYTYLFNKSDVVMLIL